jgi:predicted nuclease of predicted toxin-antitoxin system
VKLLFDQNISRRVLTALGDVFPESAHVFHLEMACEDDLMIWNYARENGFTIVTKDKDFLQRSVLMGHPPKIIHLRLGNCTVEEIVSLLLQQSGHLKAFQKHASKSYLLLPE